jgi:hypothetical protein
MKIFKNLLAILSALSLNAAALASDCYMPDQVTYCQEVGASKEYDFDAISLLKAIADNQADYQDLLSRGRLSQVKVRIEAARSPDFSNENVFVIESVNGGIFTPREYWKTYRLILSGHRDLRIADEAPMFWTSSGVREVR